MLQKIIARISVPFFFTASGFLLFRKFENDSYDVEKVKRFLLYTLRLYVVWTIIYSPFIIHGIITDEKGIGRGVLIAIRNFFLTGSYTHLWYINSLIVAVLLVCLLLRSGIKTRHILVLSFVFFLIGLLGQTYFGLLLPLQDKPLIWNTLRGIRLIIGTTRDALFEGMFFVSLGMYFAWNKEKITNGYNNVLIPVLTMAFLVAEGLIIKCFGRPLEWNTYLCSALVVFSMFRYAINPWKEWHISDRMCMWFRDIVEIVFLSHMWIRTILDSVLGIVAPSLLDTCIRYILVCLISLFLGQIILTLSKTKKFRFLRFIL